MIIRRLFISVVSILLLAGCCNCVNTVTVTNPTDVDRLPELVELNLQEIGLAEEASFVVKNHAGEEIPYQITADGNILFLVEGLKACESAKFTFKKGSPSVAQTLSCGREYADKHGIPQDVAWENDKVGFRLYSHETSPKVAGYDLFAKRGTSTPVLEDFYAKNLDTSPAWDKYYELLESEGKEAALKHKRDFLSFHIDRGYGLDCYQVGPTLGAGVASLIDTDKGSSKILYQSGYESFEIIENGPLRFKTMFTFAPRAIGKDSSVVETRIVTLDAGAHLNHTSIQYKIVTLDANGVEVSSDLSDREILTGIALREKGGRYFQDETYISYASPTQVLLDEWVEMRNGDENGTLYVGHVFPANVRTDIRESHVVAVSEYNSEAGFEYFWGFGWDRAGIESHEQWNEYLKAYAHMVRNPLTITTNN